MNPSLNITVKADPSAAEDALQQIGKKIQQAVRPAAHKAAELLYREVLRNVEHRPTSKTGNLRNAIYHAFSEDNSDEHQATYHISWNHKKAPHGHLVEFGHLQRYQVMYDQRTGTFWTDKTRPLPQPKQVPAAPFVRPAAALMPKAAELAEEYILSQLEDELQ